MDQKISALTNDTSPSSSDVLPIVNVGASSTQKITLSTLIGFIASFVKTLTNTTFDTAGTGNSFKINGTAITAVTGTGSAVLATQPTLTSQIPTTVAVSATVGGTTTLSMGTGNIQNITMGAGNTTIALSGVTTNQIFIISITQDGTGSRTVTWFSTIRWVGGTAPTLTTTASKRDTFGFVCTGSGTYDGYVIGQAI